MRATSKLWTTAANACTKVIRLIVALSMVVGSVAPTNAQAIGNVREVERTVPTKPL